MILPLAIARALNIPTFVVFDGDADKCTTAERIAQHTSDNRTLLSLYGLSSAVEMPTETLWANGLTMWKNDLAASLAQDIGETDWQNLREEIKNESGWRELSDIYKSTLFIQRFLTKAWDTDRRFPTLERLCKSILVFGRLT